MARRIHKELATLIAVNYIQSNFDKVKALVNSGYSISYANNSNGKKVFDNVLVKGEIERIKAKSEANAIISANITIDWIRKEHLRLAALCEQEGDLSTANQCLAYAGKTIAAYTDNLSTVNKEEMQTLSADELKDLQAQAEKATDMLTIKLKDAI